MAQPPYMTQAPPVIMQAPFVPKFGPHSQNMTCPMCQAEIKTSTASEPGTIAWIIGGVLCVFG